MSPDQAFLTTVLTFATVADMAAFDCSGLLEGSLAVVEANIATPDADPAGTPFYMYLPTSEATLPSDYISESANSVGGTLAGRWVQLNWTFA